MLLLIIYAVLFIHMDEQMDGRTLIGSYVCTEKPGEFKWAPGSLTQVCMGDCSLYNSVETFL